MHVLKGIVLPILTALTPFLLAGVTYYLNSKINESTNSLTLQLSQLDYEVKRMEAERLERESKQKYYLEIFNEVKSALSTDDPDIHYIVTALVLTVEDEELALRWLEVLEKAENISTENKQVIEQAKDITTFRLEEKLVIQSPIQKEIAFNWEDYDYDIFWCETSGDGAEDQAHELTVALAGQGAKGRLRVRKLPNDINQSSGYRITGYEIRRNDNEVEQADALKRLGMEILLENFKIGVSKQPTPYYLSAFICP